MAINRRPGSDGCGAKRFKCLVKYLGDFIVRSLSFIFIHFTAGRNNTRNMYTQRK